MYEGEITITKRWLDENGDPITDPNTDLPIPVVHVDTEEPVIDLPPQDAKIENWRLHDVLRNAYSFQKTTVNYTRDTLPENAVRVDDRTTRSTIYVWIEGDPWAPHAYWWSDASAAHLPDGSGGLFSNSTLYSVDLRGFDTSNVWDMSSMFSNCSTLGIVNFGSKENGDLIDTGNVKYMYWMFQNCSNLWSLDMSDLDTSNVLNMNYMFEGCKYLQGLKNDGWDTSNVTTMYGMFSRCDYLNGIDYSNLDTSSVEDMSHMFQNSRLTASADFSSWDTSKVTDMSYMFNGCSMSDSSLLSLKNWDTGSVTNMSHMFDSVSSSLTTLDLSGWDTGSVTNMNSMFYECSNLTTLDLSSWDTGSVTDMSYMFYGCGGLTTLDVSGWDTGSVTDMSGMFSLCYSLTTLDVSGWDTGSVTNMRCMFRGCNKLTTLDVSGWDTGSVTDMYAMFSGCSNLTTLDVSGWDTGKVTDMIYMFSDCSKLKTVYVGDLWSTARVINHFKMFRDCKALKGVAGTTYNSSYIDKTYARVDNPPNAPGYFTYKARAATLHTNKASASTGAQASATLLAAAPTLSFLRENGDIITYNARTATLHTNKASASTGAQASATLLAAPPTLSFLSETGDIITYKASAATLNTNKAPVSMGAQASATLPAAAPTLSFLRETGDIITNNAKKALTLTNDGTVSFSQVTNAELWDGAGSAEDKWVDNGDGTWTYKMKVFDVAADYYIWEEPLPGFSCDLDNDTGYTVIHYPTDKNVVITNTRATDDSCSLTLRKVLTGAVNDYPSEDFANRDYHFTVTLSGSGLAGNKVFGHTTFTDGVAHVTLKGGEMVTFTNIPSGVSYSVTEQEENYGGMIETIYSDAGTLNADNKNVTFTVTNNVKPSLKSLDITKTVLPYEGGELDDDDLSRVFTFNIDLHADISGVFGDLYFTAGKATAYLKHGETAHITGIPSTADSYTVTEVENSLYTCDKPVQEGALVAGETAHADFKNTKLPEEEKETGGFTITKTVNGKSTDAKFSFNVSMQNLDKNAAYPLSGGTSFTSDINGSANLTIQLAHGESVKFSDLPVGTVYTVSEQACGYYASYAISGTDRVTPLTDKNTVTDRQLATSAITVQKDDDITIAFTNTDKRFDVRVAKVDADDEFVTDAVLQIIEKGNEENVLDEWVTTEDYHTAQIPQGTYILREKQAPFGYRKADDIEFTVSANGDITINDETVYMIKMVDEPVKLSVTGAGGIYPVITASAITFTMLLLAVVIKKRSFKNKKRKGE